jgi:hypothetical protein
MFLYKDQSTLRMYTKCKCRHINRRFKYFYWLGSWTSSLVNETFNLVTFVSASQVEIKLYLEHTPLFNIKHIRTYLQYQTIQQKMVK